MLQVNLICQSISAILLWSVIAFVFRSWGDIRPVFTIESVCWHLPDFIKNKACADTPFLKKTRSDLVFSKSDLVFPWSHLVFSKSHLVLWEHTAGSPFAAACLYMQGHSMQRLNLYCPVMVLFIFFWSASYLFLEEPKKMLRILKAQHVGNLFGIQTRI